MNTDEEIKKLERKIEALRTKSLKTEKRRKTTALRRVFAVVKKFGFDSIHELLEIADTAAVATTTKKKRARINDATRKSVVKMLKAGATAAKTAAAHKISAPSVNNIKKAAGLTNASRKSRFFKYRPTHTVKKAADPTKTKKKVRIIKPVHRTASKIAHGSPGSEHALQRPKIVKEVKAPEAAGLTESTEAVRKTRVGRLKYK